MNSQENKCIEILRLKKTRKLAQILSERYHEKLNKKWNGNPDVIAIYQKYKFELLNKYFRQLEESIPELTGKYMSIRHIDTIKSMAQEHIFFEIKALRKITKNKIPNVVCQKMCLYNFLLDHKHVYERMYIKDKVAEKTLDFFNRFIVLNFLLKNRINSINQ